LEAPQPEYINEPAPGEYIHLSEQRATEWPVAFLSRPRRAPDNSSFLVAFRTEQPTRNLAGHSEVRIALPIINCIKLLLISFKQTINCFVKHRKAPSGDNECSVT
jgi:hypothetical protein